MERAQSNAGPLRREVCRGLLLFLIVGTAYAIGSQFAWGWLGANWGLTFFAPAGVTLAAFALCSYRVWPFLGVAVALAEFSVDWAHGVGPATALGYAAANTCEPVAGAVAITVLSRHVLGRPGRVPLLDTKGGALVFLAGGVLVGPLVGALIGTSVRIATAPGNWPILFVSWWAGDGLGVLVVAGAVLTGHRLHAEGRSVGVAPEMGGVLAVVAAVSVAVLWYSDKPVAYLVLPVVWWAAFRYHVVGVTLAGFVVAVVANLATAEGHGPFHHISGWSSQSRVAITQVFVAVVVLSAWMVALEVIERSQASEARQSAERAQQALSALASRSASLARLAGDLAGALNVGEVAPILTRAARDALGATVVWIMQVTSDGGALEMLDVVGATGGTNPSLRVSPAQDTLATRAWTTGRVQFFGTSAEGSSAEWPPESGIASYGPIVSALSIPLLAGGQPRGVLVMGWDRPVDFGEDDRNFAELLSGYAGQALSRARLFDAEAAARAVAEQVTDRLRLLGEVSESVSSVLDPAEISARLNTVLTPFVDQCCLFLRGGSELRQELPGVAEPGQGLALPVESAWPVAQVYASGKAKVVEMGTDSAIYSARRWAIILPLRARGSIVGVLVLLADRAEPFGPDDVDLANEIAARVAVAVDNANRFRFEHEIASILQAAVQPPEVAGVEGLLLDAVYRPAAAGVEVGGDWFDVIDLKDGRAVVALGDVMGKGLRAAVAMAAIRSALRAYARLDPDPVSVVSRLDSLVAGEYGTTFITLVYALIDIENRSVTVAHAGHPPALHVRRTGGSVYLDGNFGTPLGLGWDRPCPTTTFTLLPGEALLLYSDGAVEDRRRSITDGLAELLTAADSLGTPSGLGLCTHVAGLMKTGDDDLTLLSVGIPEPVGVPGGLRFKADPSSVAAARRLVARTPGIPAEQRDMAVVLTSELASNAVCHAATDYSVDVEVRTGTVRVAVTDAGEGSPHVERPGPDSTSGRGLGLVEVWADRWGVERRLPGKTVWFELDWVPDSAVVDLTAVGNGLAPEVVAPVA